MKKILFLFFISFLSALAWLFWPEETEEVSDVDLPAVEKREEPASLVADESLEGSTNVPDPAAELSIDVASVGPISSFPVESLELFFPQPIALELKRVIAEDLGVVYRDVESFEILALETPLLVRVGGIEYQLNERLEFFDQGRYFPEDLNEVYLYETNGIKQVFISDDVVEKYRIAQSRKEAAPRVYEDLENFLDLMNNLEQKRVRSPEGLLYLHGAARQYEKELVGSLNPESFQDAYGRYEYKQPSLLEIKSGAEFSNYLSDLGDQFVAKVYVYDKEGRLRDGSPPFVYHEGEWKLLIVMPEI